jgi:ABC-type spermidine/putrescine transport system permease subunit II
MMEQRRFWSTALMFGLALLAVLFLLLPIGAIFGLGLYYVLGIALVADLAQLLAALERETAILPALFYTPLAALCVALLATLWGLALSLLWQHWLRGGRLTPILLSALPLVLPRFGLGALFLLAGLQLAQWGGDVLGLGMVILSQSAVATPLVAGLLCLGWRRIDPSWRKAALETGAEESTIFRQLTWPVLRPYLILGALLAGLLSLGDFHLSNALGGNTPLLPGVLFSGVARNASPLYYALVATVLALDIGFVIVIARRLRFLVLFRNGIHS